MIARLSRSFPVVSLLVLGACARAGGARIAPAPAPESRYVASASGRDVGLEGVLQRAAAADVVFLGAGNITNWAYALPKELGGSPS